MSCLWTFAASALFALLSGAVPAQALLSAEKLQESCRAYAAAPDSHDALVCASYIQGYLDAARSGAELLVQPPDRGSGSETWEERATRTRLGKNYLDALRKRQHRYCIAPSISLSDLVTQLLQYLRTHPPRAQTTAADAVSRTLALHYSCDRRVGSEERSHR
jgi:hypothetical protein